jgi:phenylalanyl-tRNA synthetase beta chain
MDMNKLTEKAQEAIAAAQRDAEQRHNTQLEPEHLLLALVQQESGVVPAVLDKLGVKGPVVGFEVFLDSVPAPKKKTGTAKPLLTLAAFQPIQRDFAFVVDRDLPAEALLRAARGVDRKLISGVALFDVYEGDGLPEGKKSLAIQVTLQPQEATLTDEQIEAFSQKLIAQVQKATGGELRGGVT